MAPDRARAVRDERDGSNQRQVTKLGGANFAPSWHPDGKRLIFASNIADPEGPRLRRLPDQSRRHRPRARHLQRHVRRVPDVLARRQAPGVRVEPQREGEGETNVFIADWVE